MSRSITIRVNYRNNKSNFVGKHQPQNVDMSENEILLNTCTTHV